jgi:methylenetetrahydrofolate dehydrogenase (NADP+)/methenyltetrahydrofolate cyclohydrolase
VSAVLLDGRFLSQQVETYIRTRVTDLHARTKVTPGLAVILVGENPASKAYVAKKSRVAKSLGFQTFDHTVSATTTQEALLELIQQLNADSKVHGILLQLPLPPGLEQEVLLDAIDPRKDVDGLHPLSQGLLARGSGVLRPCTPVGSMLLIDLAYALQSNKNLTEDFQFPKNLPSVDLSGKTALVVGRSVLVGKPMVHLLLERNATVTLAHSRTKNLPELCGNTDILVAAIGRPEFIQGKWLSPKAIVIDVGINRLNDGRLVGDVEFSVAKDVCAAITPVPGGVGQMTVAMLMMNTVLACEKLLNSKEVL